MRGYLFSVYRSLFTAAPPARRRRGVTLIDTLVGVALLVIVFVGITGVFMLSIDVVTNNKARIGALALANEQMEYLRSIPYYDTLGTVGGIPAGAIAQEESISLNNVAYTRHTLILYVDRPEDGSGVNDSNGIVADSKQAKVSVSWESRGQTRTLVLVSDFSPPGVESTVPGGTIAIAVIDANALPIAGASVRIVNAATDPAIDVTSTSNESGYVTFIGAPAASGYQITVSKSGMSLAQTYSATASLTNPSPGHLTVSLNQTTQATLAIDTLGVFTVSSFREITGSIWNDTFANSNNVSSTTNIVIAADSAALEDPDAAGALIGTTVTHAYLYSWGEFSWNETAPLGTAIRYRVYADGAEIPDAALPGNAAGFTLSPVDLSSLSTSTYPVLQLRADLEGDGAGGTPELHEWEISYEYGPEPLPNVEYALRGGKTIGTDSSGDVVYKYDASGDTGAGASVTLGNMEWDVYSLSVPASSGYDIAESCPPQPNTLAPGGSLTSSLYLAAHTTNSLLVDVRTGGGTVIPNASVQLTRGVLDETELTGPCGQSFFRGLSVGTVTLGNPYTVTVTAGGYAPYTTDNVEVSGTSNLSVVLSP